MRRFPLFRSHSLLTALVAVFALFASNCAKKSSTTLLAPPTSDAPAASIAAQMAARRTPPEVARATAVKDRHWPELRAIPGVNGAAISADAQGAPVILVLTESDGVRGIPAALDGIPTRVMVFGKMTAFAKPVHGPTVEGGSSTFNENECNAGTLGCVIEASGQQYFLSCNHVFARVNEASLGEYIVSPGSLDLRCQPSTRIATLADFQPLSFTSDNYIDAAIAAPLPGVTASCSMTSGYRPSSNVAQAYVGMPVKTTGRFGVIKTGTVIGIHATGAASYSNGTGATFIEQIIVSADFAGPGDSGALVVTGQHNDPVGMVAAGGGSGATMCNDIGFVLLRFGATVCSH